MSVFFSGTLKDDAFTSFQLFKSNDKMPNKKIIIRAFKNSQQFVNNLYSQLPGPASEK